MDEKTKMIKVLENVLSTNLEQRTNSEEIINELQNKNYQGFFTLLLQILTEESSSPSVQQTAGLVLKNSLHSNDSATQFKIEEKWISLDENFRQELKNHLVFLMNSQKMRVAFLASNILAGIARIELVRNQFLNFFSMLSSLLGEKNEILIRCLLHCVGSTCFSLIEETSFDFTPHSNYIFMICVSRMKREESFEIKNSALKCINSCLEALEDVLTNENTISIFLDSLFSLCSEEEQDLTLQAMKAIYRLIGLHYKNMGQNFIKLINFIRVIQNYQSEQITMEVLEFWTVLAEIEYEMETSYHTERNIELILPYILKKLEKTDEQNEEGWNSHKAAATALEKISKTVKFELINHPIIIHFLRENLSKEEKELEMALITVGSVINTKIKTRENLLPLVSIIAEKLSIPKLQKSAFWSLTKICENNFDLVDPAQLLPQIITVSLSTIQQKNELSVYSACLIGSMGNYVSKERGIIWSYENVLTFFLPEIFNVVISEIESVDFNNFKLRAALFSCLNACISSASVDASGYLLGSALEYLISKASDCLSNASNQNFFLIIEDFLSNLISSIQIIFNTVDEQRISEKRESVKDLFINVLSLNPCALFGDVYVALSSMCKPNSYFLTNFYDFIPFLLRDLKSSDFYVLKACINFIGDVANILNKGFMAYSDEIVPDLIKTLLSPEVNSNAKPTLLSVFGDVSLSLGTSFSPYIDMTLQIVHQISTLERKFNESFIDTVRKNFLQMLDCVIISLGYSEKIRENVPFIINFAKKILNEDENKMCTVELVNVFTDLMVIYPSELVHEKVFIFEFLYAQMSNKKEEVVYASKEALQVLKS